MLQNVILRLVILGTGGLRGGLICGAKWRITKKWTSLQIVRASCALGVPKSGSRASMWVIAILTCSSGPLLHHACWTRECKSEIAKSRQCCNATYEAQFGFPLAGPPLRSCLLQLGNCQAPTVLQCMNCNCFFSCRASAWIWPRGGSADGCGAAADARGAAAAAAEATAALRELPSCCAAQTHAQRHQCVPPLTLCRLPWSCFSRAVGLPTVLKQVTRGVTVQQVGSPCCMSYQAPALLACHWARRQIQDPAAGPSACMRLTGDDNTVGSG